MQRNAIIFHGTGVNPEVAWYQWLGRRLAERGYSHDPYGCDDGQGGAMFERLGGTQVIRDDGHFVDYDQPFPTFELLDKLTG